jgi:ABC-type multidrug transport system ATPase subunit
MDLPQRRPAGIGSVGEIALVVRGLSAGYGRHEVFRDLTVQVPHGQVLGVLGPSGAGKTTLLRTIAGLLTPRTGVVRIRGLGPRDALSRLAVAYFAGDATLPGGARAAAWGRLGASDLVLPERRRIRTLSRGTRQYLGLRTVLGRPALDLIVLDEPWEALDADGRTWLHDTLVQKRDHDGAAVVLSSHRLHDLAGICDLYLFLMPQGPTLRRAHEIASAGPVTAALLADVIERLRPSLTPRGTA